MAIFSNSAMTSLSRHARLSSGAKAIRISPYSGLGWSGTDPSSHIRAH
jgi:hypothetical protein